MDLTRKSVLVQAEQFEIASAMHAAVLDSLFRVTGWQHPQAVFHGGTALRFRWDSLRFSEDLDFMIAEAKVRSLDKVMETVRDQTDLKIVALYPGGTLALKKRGSGDEEVLRWDFRWSHPNRQGKVLVKAEFLRTPERMLVNYLARAFVPIGFHSGIRITTPIPMPDLISSWADKIKAVATRPAVKWRDLFDLDFIVARWGMEGRPDDDALRNAIEATASLYDRTLDEVRLGLEEFRQGGALNDVAAFEADMARWLPQDTWSAWRDAGVLEGIFQRAGAEIETAEALLDAPRPTP